MVIKVIEIIVSLIFFCGGLAYFNHRAIVRENVMQMKYYADSDEFEIAKELHEPQKAGK